MKTITAEWLETAGACESAVADFRKCFGESCEVSVRNARLWQKKLPNDAPDDFAWLTARLMDSFDHETMEELEQRLAIEPEQGASMMERADDAVHALIHLEDDRMTKAVEEIADRSTAL